MADSKGGSLLPELRKRLMTLNPQEKSTALEENKRDPAENLGEVPVEIDGAVLIRQRMAQIGREATNTVREEMQLLGRKVAETKEQGVTGSVGDEGKRRGVKPHKTHLKTERAQSV